MDLINAIVLGIVEGLTEFLPISSTGHLVITNSLLGIDGGVPPWNVLLWVSQFGAILAVVLYFWRDLWRRTTRPRRMGWRNHIVTKLLVAMLPTIVIALPLKDYLDPLERMPAATAVALILGAVVMAYIDRRYRRRGPQELEDVSLQQAFLIGVIQPISMIPGVSRAGATIMGGMCLGLTPRVATEFSFYLAIPTMLGAALKTIWEHRAALNGDNAGIVLLGTTVAFVVALLVIAWFMGFVKRAHFTLFVVYRVVLGTLVLLLWAAGWLRA